MIIAEILVQTITPGSGPDPSLEDSMVKTIAQVVEVTDRGVVLSAERQSACSSCASAKSCGVSTLSKAFSNKSLSFEAPPIPEAKVGDWFTIGIAQSALLKAASIIYMIPLAVMILTAALGVSLGAPDGWVAVAAAAGLILGLFAARGLAGSNLPIAQSTPTVLGPASDEPSRGEDCGVLD